MTDLQKEWIASVIALAKPRTNTTEASLRFMAESFLDAHARTPGGLSVEVGTWWGGSALMFLELLEWIYPAAERPMLFTIDPYGNKPYFGGDVTIFGGLYGDEDFVRMKRLLAGYAAHAHWYCRGIEFFGVAPGLCYWQRGKGKLIEGLTFVFLDGDHDHASIAREISLVLPRLAVGGAIVIDNVDKDPETVGSLTCYSPEYGPERTPGALQARIIKSEP